MLHDDLIIANTSCVMSLYRTEPKRKAIWMDMFPIKQVLVRQTRDFRFFPSRVCVFKIKVKRFANASLLLCAVICFPSFPARTAECNKQNTKCIHSTHHPRFELLFEISRHKRLCLLFKNFSIFKENVRKMRRKRSVAIITDYFQVDVLLSWGKPVSKWNFHCSVI